MKKTYATIKDAFIEFCTLINRVEIASLFRQDKHQSGLLYKFIVYKNLKHTLLFSILAVLTVVTAMIVNIVNGLSTLRLVGEVIMLVACVAMIISSYMFLTQKSPSLKNCKTAFMIFWGVVLLGALLVIADEFNVLGYSLTYYGMMLVLIMVPVLTMKEAIAVSSVSFVGSLVITLSTRANIAFIFFAALAALVMLWCSQMIYYSIANQWLYRRRLNAAVDRCRMITETDVDSGLLNKSGLMIRFKEIVYSYSKHSTVSAIFIDIDNFKQYNVRMSFNKGDEAFSAIANCIKIATKQADVELVSRFDSDSFLLILEDKSEYETVELAEQIRADIQTIGIPYPDTEYGVLTVSVGVVYYNKGYEQSEGEIVIAADSALTKAKENGKNCICYKGQIFRKQ